MHANRDPAQDPPCETCRVDLIDENRDAAHIYNITRDQWIMGFNGPVAVNQVAIHEAMRMYRINNRAECFEKVLILCRWLLNRITDKAGT